MNGWKGLCEAVLAEAGVEHERGTVRLPYRDRAGHELYSKRFRRDGRSWYEPSGIELVPYGLETLPLASSTRPGYAALLLAERESDALAVRDVLRYRSDGRAVEYLALAMPGGAPAPGATRGTRSSHRSRSSTCAATATSRADG